MKHKLMEALILIWAIFGTGVLLFFAYLVALDFCLKLLGVNGLYLPTLLVGAIVLHYVWIVLTETRKAARRAFSQEGDYPASSQKRPEESGEQSSQ